MPKTLQTKCKTCFGGPRMILHALWKNTFSKKQYGFFTTLADPPPPGLAKDHKKYGFFFRNPSLRRIQMSPRYLSPIYGTMRRQIEEAMPRMTTKVILVFVQGRWTVSSWLPHFEHLWWNFLKFFCQNGRKAQGRRQQIQQRNHSMPNVVVDEETSLQTVSPHGPQGRALLPCISPTSQQTSWNRLIGWGSIFPASTSIFELHIV